jgi:D-alanyl-D-alanine-carboxypeptidase/D-alanyl-D-alanine-endopeptidase
MLANHLGRFVARIAIVLTLVSTIAGTARAEDKLLAEAVEFAATFIFLETKVPGLVVGVVRNGETVVRGFGEIADGSGKAPDGDTLMRIGSITKVFCGATLASMVADGKVGFTDRLQDRLGWDVTIPERDGKQIGLIDLATHASGLPREAEDSPARRRPRIAARRTT